MRIAGLNSPADISKVQNKEIIKTKSVITDKKLLALL